MGADDVKKAALTYLEAYGIPYEIHEHPPFYTVADAKAHAREFDGLGTKNLFLRNRKGDRHFLVTVGEDTRADLASLAEQFGEKKLLFASDERLAKYLGVEPGSVSLMGLINDNGSAVEVHVASEVLDAPLVHLHPNVNTASVTLTHEALTQFLATLPHTINRLDM